MLPDTYLDTLVDPLLELYEEFQQSVINDIARRLAKAGRVTDTAAWQMQRLSESGKVYETALEELAALSGQSETVLRETFEKAGVKAMRFDDAIYKAAGLDPLPLNLSPAMAQVLAAGLQKTKGVVQNLTMTTALSSQEAFIHAADLAYVQITSGAFDYQTAIKGAIKQAASQGLTAINYASGHRDQLDVALRRTVLTGVNQTVGKLQERRADEMNSDLVQTSAHIGARPSHQQWQGQVFSRRGLTPGYPDFVTSTGYGTGPGLMGWNCRHSWYPFFEGISENAYQQATLDQYADKTVTYRGEPMSVYDATQQQRAIERQIRQWKRQASALEAAGIDNTAERGKVRQYQAQMRDFTRQTGLTRQRGREQVYAGGPLAKVKKQSEFERFVDENRRSLDRAKQITPDMLDAGVGAKDDLTDYMYNFFAYEENGTPIFSKQLLGDTKNDLFYHIYSLGKGHMTIERMFPIREKAAGLLSGNIQAGGKVFSLKERRILERLASIDDSAALDAVDEIRDQRLRGTLAQKRYGGGGRRGAAEPGFRSAQAADSIAYLQEYHSPGWRH